MQCHTIDTPLNDGIRESRGMMQEYDGVAEVWFESEEELVSAMEDGDLSLEESLQAFEKGIKLTRECQSALEKAEQKVQKLLDDAGNTEVLEFDDEEDN